MTRVIAIIAIALAALAMTFWFYGCGFVKGMNQFDTNKPVKHSTK